MTPITTRFTCSSTESSTLEQAISIWCDENKPNSGELINLIGTFACNEGYFNIHALRLSETGLLHNGIIQRNGGTTIYSCYRLSGSDAIVSKIPSNITFDQDSEGNWGYIPSGADAVIPFKTNSSFIDFYGCANSNNSYAVNIKKNSNILKITGAGYRGSTSNANVTLLVLGVSDENYTDTYHVYNGSWLPTISSITLTATLTTQEIDISNYPRIILYAQYGTGTSGSHTNIYFHVQN